MGAVKWVIKEKLVYAVIIRKHMEIIITLFVKDVIVLNLKEKRKAVIKMEKERCEVCNRWTEPLNNGLPICSEICYKLYNERKNRSIKEVFGETNL